MSSSIVFKCDVCGRSIENTLKRIFMLDMLHENKLQRFTIKAEHQDHFTLRNSVNKTPDICDTCWPKMKIVSHNERTY